MPFTDITALLHRDFPLARAMQVHVTAWNQKSLTLTAPLSANLNHSGTAFGGSISALGILGGYGLLHLTLQHHQISANILIQKSSTDFRRPIDAELSAVAAIPAPETLDDFLANLRKKRKARLTLATEIFSETICAATHTGLYVAILY